MMISFENITRESMSGIGMEHLISLCEKIVLKTKGKKIFYTCITHKKTHLQTEHENQGHLNICFKKLIFNSAINLFGRESQLTKSKHYEINFKIVHNRFYNYKKLQCFCKTTLSSF